jgi:hypothetical protein
MSDKWKILIGRILNARSPVERADTIGMFQYGLPRLGASEEALAAAESRIGALLPVDLREFLQAADGWPLCWHDVTFLGTGELERGTNSVVGSEAWGFIEAGVFEQLGVRPEALVLVAREAEFVDRFFMDLPTGNVLWIAGNLVERFASLAECLEFFVNIQGQDLREVRRAVAEAEAEGREPTA